jgi:hypothetical protein
MSRKRNGTRKDWRAVNLRVPAEAAERIDRILEAKPHYSQQAVIIDAILAGLAAVEAKEAS